MTMTRRPAKHDGGESDPLLEYRDWWSIELGLPGRDFDALGHLTAAASSAIYEEAFAGLAEHAWHDPDPSFVVTRMSIDWHRKVRRDDGPIRVFAAVRTLGWSSFEVAMVLCAADGHVCSTAETHSAAWDRDEQKSRFLTDAERAGLLRHSAGADGGQPG